MPVLPLRPKPACRQQTEVENLERFRLHPQPAKRKRAASPASGAPPESAEPEPTVPALAEQPTKPPSTAVSSGLTEHPQQRKAQPGKNRAQSAIPAQSAQNEQSSEQSSNGKAAPKDGKAASCCGACVHDETTYS